MFVEHYVDKACGIVEVGGIVDACCAFERVAGLVFVVEPFAEFQNTAFLRCEIEVVGVVECVQDIKVVAQFPIAGISGGLCG